MSPRQPPPKPIIPPDPPPPPDEAPEPEEQPATRRRQESDPDLGDKRRIPRRSDPPIVIGRKSRESIVHDSRSTPSVGSGAWGGFDLIHVHDR